MSGAFFDSHALSDTCSSTVIPPQDDCFCCQNFVFVVHWPYREELQCSQNTVIVSQLHCPYNNMFLHLSVLIKFQSVTRQDGLAEAQHAAQQLLPENHTVLLEARSLRQRQAQMQSSVDSLQAAKVSAQQDCSMYGEPCLFAGSQQVNQNLTTDCQVASH